MSRTQEELQADPGRPPRKGRRSTRGYRRAQLTVAALAAAAAVGGAVAGCHPTGTEGIDVVYTAAFAGGVTALASRASRSTLLVLAAVGFALSRSWLWIPAGAALVLAFAATFQRRSHTRLAALVGAISIQVVLRWPSHEFHGFTAAAAAVVLAPVLFSGWRHCRGRVRRLVVAGSGVALGLGVLLAIPVVVTGTLSLHRVDAGMSLARRSLSQVEGGQTQAAIGQLRLAADDLGAAKTRLTGWWNAGAFLIPGVAQQERFIQSGATEGAHLTAIAKDEAGAFDVQSLRYHGGRVDLQALSSLGPPAQRLDTAIARAQSRLTRRSWPWLLPPLSDRLERFGTDLNKARNADDIAVLATRDLPGILGGDGVRHYLVAFMSPAETRGLGGFIGAYGLLTVDNGSIHLTTSGRATDLVSATAHTKLVAPADYVARYGAFHPERYFEDLTYSPVFPSVEQAMAGLYPQVGGVPIDGAMVLDPYALGALLQFTGPISIPGLGFQLTSQNTADVLLRQQYLVGDPGSQQRHDLLQDALRAGFSRLTAGSLPSPKTISTILGPEVKQGRLLFWSSHPTDQPLLERLATGGQFPQRPPSGDFLAVTLANSGNSKIDAYLHQQISDRVRYDPSNGRVEATVTIQELNDAPSSGLPLYVIGSHAGSGIPPGTNLSWLSLYTPLNLVSAQINGAPIGFSPGTREGGVTAYSTFVRVPAKSLATLTVDLEGTVPSRPDYRMEVWQQPLSNPQTFSVTVTPTVGWALRGQPGPTWTAGQDQTERHTWSFR